MKSVEIEVNRTQGEWDELESIAKKMGKPDLKTFMRVEIWKLAKKISECEECVSPAKGEVKRKTFYTSVETSNILDRIALVMKKPRGAVINELIITPTLEKHKKVPS